MYERVLDPVIRNSGESVLLLGPRQVGKSTLIRGLDPNLSINLADPEVYREYVSHPESLMAQLRAADPATRSVFIDEIQRVPALLDVIQVIIDEAPARFRFLLTGSSARKLRRGQANLLPGRIVVHQLHPLLACELGNDFNLERYLAHGTLPGIASEADPNSRARILRSYANTYIREEIQAEALVRDVGGFSRLLDLMAASSGRIVNLSALSQDAGIAYDTARRYVGVLEDTLVAFSVPAWRGSDRAGLLAHPKIFLFDAGVRNALLRRPLDKPLADEVGYLLEHLVAYELYRRQGEIWPEAKLFHYRTRSGAEVDFILEIAGELWAIEVKSSTSIRPRDVASLRAVVERVAKVRRRIVVFLGSRPQALNGIEVLPLKRFLDELPAA